MCLFVCLSVYLSISLYLYLYLCLFVCLSVYLSYLASYYIYHKTIYHPICSMVLDYFPTFARTKSPSFVGKYTSTMEHMPIGSMYAIYGNIYHHYTPNLSIYTIHGSYGLW
jgi:hypothetical protein